MKPNLNSIKTLALTGALAVSLAGFAQTQNSTDTSSTATTSTATKSQSGKNDLGLNADQKSQIKQIRQNEKQQIQTVKADNSLNKDQKKAKIKDIRQNSTSQINSLLTPEQQQKFAQRRANHRKHHKHARQNSFR
jgi:Spy/CpxP family protein refolding chaperone